MYLHCIFQNDFFYKYFTCYIAYNIFYNLKLTYRNKKSVSPLKIQRFYDEDVLASKSICKKQNEIFFMHLTSHFLFNREQL